MKNIIIVIILLCTFQTTAWPQIEKGGKNIGGTFSIYGDNNKYSSQPDFSSEDNSSNVIIEPMVAFMLTNKTSLGLSLGYSGSSINNNDEWKQRNSAFLFGVLTRHHFMIGEKFAFYFQEGLKFSLGTEVEDNETNDYKYKTAGISLAISPGLIYFPTKKIGIESGFGQLYYQSDTKKRDESGDKSTYNNYGFNFNMTTLYLGFRYYF